MISLSNDDRCPCGTGETYAACCGRFHSGQADAPTAEALMRSRFTAFSIDDTAYLLRTWHPSTRPSSLDTDPTIRWQRLDVLGGTGGPFDDVATVHFAAHYRSSRGATTGQEVRGVHEENSSFSRENGRWYYVDG